MRINPLIFVFIYTFSFASGICNAQSWSWGRVGTTKPSNAWGVATDKFGNVYGAGVTDDGYGISGISFGSGVTTPVGFGLYKTFWVKYSSTGIPLWAGGTVSGDTWLNNITTDSAGNLIVFGYFVSNTMKLGTVTLTNAYPYGTAQFFLAKISPAGTVLWAIADGQCVNYHFLMFNSTAKMLGMGGVTTDSAGNIYITSTYNSATMNIGSLTLTNSMSGTDEIFVAKYSPAGVLAWATSAGGTGSDYGLGITVAPSGSVYVCGAFSSPTVRLGTSVLLNTTTYPMAYITKISATGTPLWGQEAGGLFGAYASGLTHDGRGNVYMVGGFTGNTIMFGSTTLTRSLTTLSANLAMYLVQYTPADTAAWGKSICSASRGVSGYGVAMASCGQIWANGGYSQAADIDGHTFPVVTDGAWAPDPLLIVGYDIYGSVVGYAGLSSGGDNQSGIACDKAGNAFVCADNLRAGTIIGPDTLAAPPAFGSIYIAKYANNMLTDTTFASQNISVCSTDSVTLRLRRRYIDYYWSDGSRDSILRVSTSGTYWVCGVSCGDTVHMDTFHVTAITSDTAYNRFDKNICRGYSMTLNAAPGYSTYYWSNGAGTDSIIAGTVGTYYVKATALCSLRVDTFHLALTPDDTSYVTKVAHLCKTAAGQTLFATVGYSTYYWNTGATTQSIPVITSGEYTAFCSNPCKILVENIDVHLYDSVRLNFDVSLSYNCDKDTAIFINNSENALKYTWDFGDHSTDTTFSPTHIYYPRKDTTILTVTLHGYNQACNSDTLSKDIILYPITQEKFLELATINQSIMFGSSIQLNATGAWIYYWMPDDGTLDNRNINNPVATPTKKTRYTVYGHRKYGCIDSANVTIDIITSDEAVPTAFSPNGDGINDIFALSNSQYTRLVDFSIYNRWGERVYHNTTDASKGWDGNYKGVPQEIGTYFYMIIAAKPTGENKVYKGDVTLLR